MEYDNELTSSIAPDVMRSLARAQFFEKLDDVLCPDGGEKASQSCDHTFKISEGLLSASGFDREALSDILAVLRSQGACCDCEVLYNVAENSRLKAVYWRARVSPDAQTP